MFKSLFIILLILPVFIFSQETNTDTTLSRQMVEIITYDNNEYIGYLSSENDETITITTLDGINIMIPKASIVKQAEFYGKSEVGKILRADPNKSMYMFAPSAFPIGHQKSYCRDFCVVFPSYNRGFGDNISVQMGAFWFPGVPFDETPLVGSVKMSLPSIAKTQFAGGIMYVRLPGFGATSRDKSRDDDENIGMGFTFITGTIGDNFTHASASIGWGYSQVEGEWDFMDEPILVLAGNYRSSDRFALIYEGWFFPEAEIETQPMTGAIRFLGKRFSFDFGGIFIMEMEGVPFPIINFTYYLN